MLSFLNSWDGAAAVISFNPQIKNIDYLLNISTPMSLRRGETASVCVCDWWTGVPRPMVRMHTGVSLEMCSLVPLTSSWTNACPSAGAPCKKIQSRAAEIEKQMAGDGCIERLDVKWWWVRQWRSVTGPGRGQRVIWSSGIQWPWCWTRLDIDLLDCLERRTAVFSYLRLMFKCFLVYSIHQCWEEPPRVCVWTGGRHSVLLAAKL